MFGVSSVALWQSADTSDGFWDPLTLESLVASCGSGHLFYLDSWSRPDDFSFDVIRPAPLNTDPSAAPYAAPVLVPTCVPSRKTGFAMSVDVVTAYGTGGPTTTPSGGTWQIDYKDPCVVAVPSSRGGGWLMILARSTCRTSVMPPGKGQAFFDIVAYWSDNLDFSTTTGKVEGPHLLVSGLRALPQPDATADPYDAGRVYNGFRPYLSVPAAAFDANDDLYLYYVVEHNTIANPDKPNPEAGEFTPFEDLEAGYTDAALAYLDAFGEDAFWGGTACAMVPSDRVTLLTSPPAYDEEDWPWEAAIVQESDLRGLVRRWTPLAWQLDPEAAAIPRPPPEEHAPR
ncbi:MAG: hypothetical protein ACOZNI_19290 [Myxococcota bacterium]